MSTVAIDEVVHQRLQHLKQTWGLSTYNEVIHRLLDTTAQTPASMFGVDPKLGRLDRHTRNEMWGD